MLTYSWLSEASDIAIVLFRYIRKITDASRSIETNFADPDILAVSKLGKKVADERYRILQFMRFQKTTEGIYYGAMEPLYDVFPLTIRHFRDRFADQKWLIYDVKRHYGYYYDGKEVNEITFADPKQTHLLTGKLDESLLDKNEKLFQTLWKSYFKSICIKERLNPDLEMEGVVFTMYDSRTNLSMQVVENVKANLQENICETVIPRNIRLAEAPSYGMPITMYDPKSSGADSYRKLADELINRKGA